MKKILNGLLVLVVLFLTSCKKDEVRAVLHTPSTVNGFTASSSQVVLSSENDSMTVTKFSWNAADYGYSASVTYTLLFDVPSDTGGANGWKNAVKVTIATDSLAKSWLGTDLNHMLNQMGLDVGVASTVVVRLKIDANQSTGGASTVPTVFADLPITVTPYKIVLIYPKLYLAGDFLIPNWTQINQPGWILASVKSNGSYEGYVNFPNANNNFKLCTQLDWNGTNYGWGGTATTMDPTAAGNLYASGPGYCRVIADVNVKTLSIAPTQWHVAGDFNAWSPTATPLTFDAGTNTWTATGVSMTAGNTFKFVGDPGWTYAFGLDTKGNLVFQGGNITAAKAGTFTVTLDLSQGAGNYTYSVK